MQYLLLIDDDRFDLNGNITVGRHLDNDLVVAGEDVLDFHARIEVRERGPWLVRLGEAPVHINHASVESSTGLIPGDEIVLGQHTLVLDVQYSGAYVKNWRLLSRGGSSSIRLASEVLVGRSADCDLCISEGFVSRRHAQLLIKSNMIWLKDLGSSNGTFVNGERVSGSVRLLHGDEIAFDTSAFQLVGEAEHLTPVVEFSGQYADSVAENADLTESSSANSEKFVEAVVSTVEVPSTPLEEFDEPGISINTETSSSRLVGLTHPILNEIFSLTLGRYLMGRDSDADIHIQENSVSGKHAELDVRIEGVYLTNLIATNGTQVNAAQVQTQRLKSGDRINLGRVRLIFQDAHTENPNDGQIAPKVLIGMSLALLVGLAWFFVF